MGKKCLDIANGFYLGYQFLSCEVTDNVFIDKGSPVTSSFYARNTCVQCNRAGLRLKAEVH